VNVIGVLGTVDAPADEGKAIAIERDHADAAAIGKGFEGHIAKWRMVGGE
jgi:hypothetical protein